MKKILLLTALCAVFFVSAQINPNTPWSKELGLENRSQPVKFQDFVDAGNAYWETHDKDAKGSGYKPFKRWEFFWQHFVDEQGYLPTSLELWNKWVEAESRVATRNPQVDISNWTSLGPTDFANRPTSIANIGRINVIIKDPNNANIYYAGAPSGGIWKSTDSGLSWTPLGDNLPQIGVSGIVIDHNNSNIIYIATGDDELSADTVSAGVFKSTDGGSTWQQTGLNPGNAPTAMNDIYMHPSNSNILWVGTSSGVYKTTDAGVTWTNRRTGNIRDIKIKPGDPSIVYAVTSSTFYRSTNGGDSFSSVTSGLPVSSGRLVIDVTPANSNVVYVVSALTNNGYQGIYKSTNSGVSFTKMLNTFDIFESTQSWYDLALAVSDTNENEIYVGVLNIWKSVNGGNSFTKVNEWFVKNAAYTHADIHFLRFYDGELYAGTDGGFFKSSNGGTSFTDYTEGMQISQFYRIDVSQQTSNKIAGGTQDNGGFGYFNQWYNYHGGDGMESVIDPNNDNLYYGFMQFGQNIFVNTNSGQSGSVRYGGPENGNWITPLAINSDSEVIGAYSRLYQFTGSSWSAISSSFFTPIDALEIDPNNPENVYVAINNTLRKSTNKGATFLNVESFLSNITSIEVNNNDSSIVYVTTSGFSGGVFRSTDGGLSFTNINGSLPSVVKLVVKHRPNDLLNSLYLGTHLGVYYYNDTVGDWEAFDNNLPNVPVFDLAINTVDENITAGTYGRGIWRSPLGDAQLVTDDVKLITINKPSPDNIYCGEVAPQIKVINNGVNTVNNIAVTYAVDGGANSNFNWSGSLAPSATTTIDIPTLNLTGGEHTLNVSIDITNDAFASNNARSKTFNINGEGEALVVNTFETVGEELLTFNEGGVSALWERGVPTGTLLNTAQSGTQVYGTNLDGNHPDLTKAFLFSDCYDLTNVTSPVLKFHMAFDIEFDWDLVYVEYSLNQGDSWALLGTASDPNWYNSSRIAGDGVANNCFNCVGGQWTGTDATMKEYSYALDALTNESSVLFRMVFHSDESVNEEGVIIDNFYIDGTLSTNDYELEGVSVYPNPSNDVFNIRLNNNNVFNYRVTDITGKVIMKASNIVQNTYPLDMEAFSSGVYFLTITADGRSATKKLILK